jgi:hypothetical protein
LKSKCLERNVGRPGQRNYGSIRLSKHAIERFIERFGADPHAAESILRQVLSRTRRLGRNPRNRAIATIANHEGNAIVAILQNDTCITVLTWDQFEPCLGEFGRPKIPRKWGRFLRRLSDLQSFVATDERASHNS